MNKRILLPAMATLMLATTTVSAASPFSAADRYASAPVIYEATRASSSDIITTAPSGEKKIYIQSANAIFLFMGTMGFATDAGYKAEMVFTDNNEVYVYNPISGTKTGSYMKGELNGNDIVFEFPQALAMGNLDGVDGVLSAKMIYYDDHLTAEDFIFCEEQTLTYHINEDGSITQPDDGRVLALCMDEQWTGVGALHYVYNPADGLKLIDAPESSLARESWNLISFGNLDAHISPMISQAEVVFSNDKKNVWIKGLNGESWIVGDIDGDKATFQGGQYLGFDSERQQYRFFYGATSEMGINPLFGVKQMNFTKLDEIVLNFDATTKTLKCAKDENLLVNNGNSVVYCYSAYLEPTIQYQAPDAAPAAPVDPMISFAYVSDWDGYFLTLDFMLFPVGTNYTFLDKDNLYYNIVINGEVHTFTPDRFPCGTDLTDIKYSDDYAPSLYEQMQYEKFLQMQINPDDVIETAGVQMFYQDGNNRLYSQLVTINLETSEITVSDPIKEEEAEPAELYLVGSMTDWGINADYKFTLENDTYTLKLDELDGEFKITTANAEGNCDWNAVNFGGDYTLEEGGYSLEWNGKNLTAHMTDVTLTIVYDANDNTMGLSVAGTVKPEEPVVIGDLYLVGDKTDWTIKPEYKLTKDGDKYTYTGSELTGKFKVAGEPLWTGVNLGAAEAQNLGFGEVELVNNGQDITFTEAGEVIITVTITEDGKSGKLTIAKGDDGVESLAQDDAECEWYNVQGVRVAQPTEPGLYIRRCGSESSKVMVK